MKKTKSKAVAVFQTKNGAIELRGDFDKETLWATQAQMTEIFDIDRTVVTKHIGNILKSKEIDEKKQCAKNAHCKFRPPSIIPNAFCAHCNHVVDR